MAALAGKRARLCVETQPLRGSRVADGEGAASIEDRGVVARLHGARAMELDAKATKEQVWDAVRQGKHGALLGVRAAELARGWSPLVVRVRCEPGRAPFAPLVEAREAIERLFGASAIDAARGRVLDLRRRLLGESPEPPAGAALVDALNRLALRSGREAVLVVDTIDAADDATNRFLRRMIAGQERVSLPIVISTRSAEPSGVALEVVREIAARGGVVASASSEAPVEAPKHDARSSLRALAPEVVRVLRAAACAPEPFDAARVAAAIGVSDLAVLDRLQAARDAGVPIEDYGGMLFRFPASLVEELRAGLLPSYARALAEALAAVEELDVAMPERPSVAPASAGAARDVAEPFATPPREEPRVSPRATEGIRSSHAANDAEDRAPAPPPPPVAPPSEEPRASTPIAQTSARASTAPARVAPPAQSRTDRELWAAGIDDVLAGAKHAEELGEFDEAVQLARVALARVEELPKGDTQRRLRGYVLFEIGRLLWSGIGVSRDFTLKSALEVLDRARAEEGPGDTTAARARLAVLTANVCYDLGDAKSLDRALAELATASRLLLDAGDAYGAARLLNDQAAVYVRMGDPVRAAHLLEESRKVFEERADTDRSALAEVAETDHLLARIPLHVEARPGLEREALAVAMRHAQSAEAAFRRLGAMRSAARVRETMGRLELAAGRVRPALEHLGAAARAQEKSGDAVGLARTSAAMAEALGALGRYRDAFDLLSESLQLNVVKGSPLGLAFNRRTFDKLVRAAEAQRIPTPSAALARALSDAEAVLGRVTLPGERS